MASQLTSAEAHHRLALIRPLRSLRFDILYQLTRVVAENQPVGYQRLYGLIVEAGISTRGGKPLANASFYHVLTAAKTLGLLVQPASSKQYHVSELGSDYLMRTERVDPASEGFEKRLLAITANLVSTCPTINEGFFWLFRGPDLASSLHNGHHVNLAPINTPEKNDRESGPTSRKMAWKLTSTFCEQPLTLDTVETQSIVLGLRQWCLELGVLDELIVPMSPTKSRENLQVLFPINPLNGVSSADFFQEVLPHFWAIATHTANYWSASVPELLYRVCPAENISVEKAKEYLQKWIEEHRRHIAVTTFSPSIAMSAWTRRSMDYTAMLRGYLQQGDSYVSHVNVFDDAIGQGHFGKVE